MIILRPLFLAAKNRFTKSGAKGEILFRDGILLCLAAGIMGSTYYGTQWLLEKLSSLLTLAYMSPLVPLVLVLLILSGMLLISTIVGTVGSFYLSDDLDLLLASPVSLATFFFQRLGGVIAGTSLLSLVFMLPVFAGYYVRFDQGLYFVQLTALCLIPYFLLPGALSFIIATGLVLFVPFRRTKVFLALFIMLILISIWFGIDVVRLILQSKSSAQDIVHLVKFFSAAEILWLPSTWIGEIFSIALGLTPGDLTPRFLTLYAVTVMFLAAAYTVFLVFYRAAYSSMKNHRIGKRYTSPLWRRIASYTSRSDRQWVAVAVKDVKLISRDMSQLFQGVLLLGIFIIYVYNLRLFAGFASVGPQDPWWANFLFVSNFCMSAFIATALCTRFVFPSISLEGRSFPLILVKAPYALENYMKGKFFFWYGIVSVIHSLVVGIGTFAAGGAGVEVVLSMMCSWVICYGLVGLALGMGAIYSRFDWESASQLAVGFGNIIFMLSASSLILVNIFPVWLLFQYLHARVLGTYAPQATIVVLLFCAGNFAIGAIVMRRGMRALDRHRL